jgi:exopolysaccharide production protein ExoQ
MSTSVVALKIPRVATHPMNLAAATVGFFFSFRVFLILITVRIFQSDAQTGTLIGLILNYLLFLAVAFNSIGTTRNTLASTLQSPSFRWVIGFLAVSGCSLLWTVAISIPAAVAFWVAMAADTALVILLFRTEEEQVVLNSVFCGFILGAVVTSAIAWLLPAQSDLRLGDEELLGPNQIGYTCALAVFLAQYLIASGGKKWKLPAIFLAITLLRSFSKTSIIAFGVAQTVLLLRNSTFSRRAKLTVILSTGIVLAAFSSIIAAYVELYATTGNSVVTLTGRLGIWASILELALQRPILGHGFHSVWKVVPAFNLFVPRHAHNELLQQFYAYGIVGIVLLFGLYGSFYRQMRRLPAGPLRALAVGLLLFAVVRGFADTEVFDLSLPLWMIALLGIAAQRLHPLRESQP